MTHRPHILQSIWMALNLWVLYTALAGFALFAYAGNAMAEPASLHDPQWFSWSLVIPLLACLTLLSGYLGYRTLRSGFALAADHVVIMQVWSDRKFFYHQISAIEEGSIGDECEYVAHFATNQQGDTLFTIPYQSARGDRFIAAIRQRLKDTAGSRTT